MGEENWVVLENALRTDGTLHAFRSGGGLRVVSLRAGPNDGQQVGYGEHPHIEEALDHAGLSVLRPDLGYHDFYGRLFPHYLTGENQASGPLDA